jgi:hypothetical protein
LIAVIVLFDQLLWRPLLAWADRFKMEMVTGERPPRSWFYEALRSSQLVRWLGEHWWRPMVERLETSPPAPDLTPQPPSRSGKGELPSPCRGGAGGEVFPVTVTLSQREIILAALIGGFMGARAISKRYKQRHENCRFCPSIEGIAAEIAVAKALRTPYRPKLDGFGAPDVEHLHVRQTAHRDGSLIIRPGDPDGVYLLAVGQCPVFRIVGWIHSYDAKQPQYWRAPNGGPGAWFVPQRRLTRSSPR